jgi:hypothetical protein
MPFGDWAGTSPPPDGLFSVLMHEELSFSVDGQQASLGYQQVHLPAVPIDWSTMAGHGDHQDIRIMLAGVPMALSGRHKISRRAATPRGEHSPGPAGASAGRARESCRGVILVSAARLP